MPVLRTTTRELKLLFAAALRRIRSRITAASDKLPIGLVVLTAIMCASTSDPGRGVDAAEPASSSTNLGLRLSPDVGQLDHAGGALGRPEHITPEAEATIAKGLRFLVKVQERDGSWRSPAGYPTAMTSLAGLALLAAGNTPVEGPYAVNVRRAMDYLISNSAPSGLIARVDEEQSCMHGHGFAMLFLAESFGMERDTQRQSKIRRVLEKAIVLTGQSQSARGGWLYTPNSGGDEGSVTVTQIQGLRACRDAGIHVPKAIIDRACKYIADSANDDGGISYRVGQPGSRPAITAAAVATMYNAGQYEDPIALKALEYIKRLLAGNAHAYPSGGHEYYAMLYASQAMYLSSEENWNQYFPRVRDHLIKAQSGSGGWTGDGIGEVYGTSIALVTLQLPYAYLPVFQR